MLQPASCSVLKQLLWLQKERHLNASLLLRRAWWSLWQWSRERSDPDCFSKVRDGARMLKKQEHKNQDTGVWLTQCRRLFPHMFNCTFDYRSGGQAVNMQGISNSYRQLGLPIFFSNKSSYSRDLCSLVQTQKKA